MKKRIIAMLGIITLSCSMFLTACGTEEVIEITELTGEVSLDETFSEMTSDLDIKEIYIDIEDEDWQAILDAPLDEEYYSVDVTVDDETVADAGFRTKGNSSLTQVANSDSERYGFRVKLDKYNDDGEICGTNEFVLNGSYMDPSYMREYLAYMAVAEIGGITPDVSYANLYVNDEYYGLYLYVEAYDDSFIESISDSDDTTLYKADGERCTLDSSAGTSGFEVKYGDDEEMENLDDLIEAIELAETGDYSDLENILDIDSVLQAMAMNYMCGNYDSYSGDKAHNYYLLYADGEFTYIGWDYNMAFGGYAGDNGASLSVDPDEPIYKASLEERPLFAVMLENEEYVAKYETYLEELAEFLSDWESMIADIESEIEDYVANDPTAFYTYEEFKANLELTGTDYSDMQVTTENMRDMGEMPEMSEMPEGLERPEMGEMPEGVEMPGMGEMPADVEMPEGMEMQDGERGQGRGEMSEGMEMPAAGHEQGVMPEDLTDEELAELMENMPEEMKDREMIAGESSKDVISIADYISTVLQNYYASK